MFIGITREGYVKSTSIRSFKATDTVALRDNDSMLFSGEVSTLDVMLLFTTKGNYIYLPVYKIPVFKWKDLGTHINNLVQMTEQEAIVKILKISNFNEDRNLLFVTRNNLVKQTELKEFEVSRYTKTVRAISLSKNDEVVRLQDFLKAKGMFPTNVQSTGYFGSVTKKAVITFQESAGLVADGVVGTKTLKELNK